MKSLLARLLLLVSIAILPAVGFLTYSENEARNVRQHLMEDEAQRLVRLVSAEQQRILEGAEQVLIAVSGAPGVQDHDPERCPRLLDNLLRHAPRYVFAGVLGLDGHLVCATGPFDRSLDNSDRAYFRLAVQTGGFVIGNYTVGRTTKTPTIHMAQPLRNQDGAVTGVVDVALDLTWLRQQLERLALPPGTAVSIMDRNGVLLARTPDGERYVGQPLSAANGIVLVGDRIQVTAQTARDGRARLVGYSPPGGDPKGLTIAVGLDRDATFTEITRANQMGLVLIIGGTGLALLVTALLSGPLIKRPFNRLLVAADRWRTGDLTVRTGIRTDGSEFGRLGAAFDTMAGALAQRELAFHAALEATTDSVVVLDRDWRFLYLNRHAIGQIAEGRNLLGQVFWDAFPLAAESPFGHAYREAVASGTPTHAEADYAPLGARFDAYAYPSVEGLTIFFRNVTEQRRVEAALHAAQARATEILEGIDGAFLALDAQWRITYVNRHALDLAARTRLDLRGMAPEQLVGRAYLEAFPEAAGSRTVEVFTQVMADRTTCEFETISPVLKRWIGAVAFPQPDGGIAVFYRDISDRKSAEAALQESEKRRALAITAAQLGIWESDLRAGSVRFDQRTAEITGCVLPAGQWLPADSTDLEMWRDTIHPEDRAPRVAAIADLVEGRTEASHIEYRLRRLTDGAWVWIAHRAIVIERDQASGQAARLLGVVQDITAQREADLERQQLLQTIDLAPLVTCDMDGIIRFWSKGSENVYGFTAEQALGRRLHDLLHTDLSGPLADIGPALLASAAWRGDLVQRRRDGTEVIIAAHEALLRDASGQPASVIISIADVTGLRQAQTELHRLNLELEARVREEVEARTVAQGQLAQAQKVQALGQLAGGIAHDFNNILQAVSGAMAVIERRPGDTERVRRFAHAAGDAAERGASITGRLLAFSRRSDLRTEPQDIAAVLDAIREVLAHTLGTTVEVCTAQEPGLPPLLADRGQLETALVNLATNARDAMPDGGRITLAATAEAVTEGAQHPAGLGVGAYVRISVSDTGAGMDEATLARASEPFFTTKVPGHGTGLGLAMVRGFAEQSHGGVSIVSKLGGGTTVSIWLPAGAASVALPRRTAGGATVADRPDGSVVQRVLLVDDDELVRETMRAQLEDSGYVVQTASSGQQALDLLDAGMLVDILITDLSMPGVNGLVTIREAHRRRPGLPAVLLTGYAGERAALAAEDGSFLLLRKPAGGTRLISCIEAAIGKEKAA